MKTKVMYTNRKRRLQQAQRSITWKTGTRYEKAADKDPHMEWSMYRRVVGDDVCQGDLLNVLKCYVY